MYSTFSHCSQETFSTENVLTSHSPYGRFEHLLTDGAVEIIFGVGRGHGELLGHGGRWGNRGYGGGSGPGGGLFVCFLTCYIKWNVKEFACLIFYFCFFKLFIYLFIYLFMAVLGLRFCARAFSSCSKWGPLFIALRGPPIIAASLVAEHRLQTRRLSNCGSRA